MYRKGEDQYYTPDELGYKDRKMLKWQGFILSDHMEQQIQENEAGKVPQAKLQQSPAYQQKLLRDACEHRWEVSIQLNVLQNGLYQPDLIGSVEGVENTSLFLQIKGKLQVIDMEYIRHVEFTDRTKWYDRQ